MAELKYDKKTGRLLFTKQMKKEYTILMPNIPRTVTTTWLGCRI